MNNSSTSVITNKKEIFYPQVTVYIIVCLIGSIGNILTAIILLQPYNRRKASAVLLLNLTICDMIVALISIPLDVTEMIMGYFPFSDTLCRIIYPFQTSLTIVSSWTLVFMMIERNFIIQQRASRTLTTKIIYVMASGAWILPIILVTPYGFFLIYDPEKDSPSCYENWHAVNARKIYTIVLFSFEYIIPMTIIMILVIKISCSLKSEYKLVRKGTLGLDRNTRRKRMRRCSKLAIIFIVIVTIYGILKLPNNIYWLYLDFVDLGFADSNPIVGVLVSLASYATSLVNPFILYLMSQDFRKHMISYITCRRIGKYHSMFQRSTLDNVKDVSNKSYGRKLNVMADLNNTEETSDV